MLKHFFSQWSIIFANYWLENGQLRVEFTCSIRCKTCIKGQKSPLFHDLVNWDVRNQTKTGPGKLGQKGTLRKRHAKKQHGKSTWNHKYFLKMLQNLCYNYYGCARDFDFLSNSRNLGRRSGRRKFDLSPEWPAMSFRVIRLP